MYVNPLLPVVGKGLFYKASFFWVGRTPPATTLPGGGGGESTAAEGQRPASPAESHRSRVGRFSSPGGAQRRKE